MPRVRLEPLSGTHFAVVDDAGERVGLAEVTDDGPELTLRHLDLEPAAQGRGLGSAVIADVLDRAAAAGQTVVLRVEHTNPRARALYERPGFEVDEERERSTQLRHRPR